MAVINVDDIYILGETGAQVDKVTGLFTKDEGTTEEEKAFAQLNIGASGGGGGGGRNLLDNPWFTVNQRGRSSYNSADYSVDRWLSNGTQQVTVSSAGVTLGEQGYRFVQRMENPSIFAGKTLTISAKTNAANVRFAYWDSTSDYNNGSAITVPVVDGYASLTINITNGIYAIGLSTASGTGGLYRAMKLELGSVSTLANDAPPDYASELMKCQYYFQRIKGTGTNYGPVGVGYALSTSSAAIIVPLAAPLRRTTVTVSSSGNLSMLSGGTAHTPNSVSYYDHTDQQLRLNCVVSNSLTSGNYCYLQFAQNAAYIDLSADL